MLNNNRSNSSSRTGYAPTYFEYHGVDPGAYYGLAYRQDGGILLTPNRKGTNGKKSTLASRLSTHFDKFTRGSIKIDKRSPSGNRKGLQENSFRDLRNLTTNNIPPPSPTINAQKGHHQSRAFSPRTNRALISPRTSHTTELRSSINQPSVSSSRYFMHHRHLPPTPWSPPTSKTLEPSNSGGPPHHYIHPPRCVDLADDDFENCAFNGNVCLCEEQWSGTQRLGVPNRLMRSMSGSSGPCRQCGLDKLIIKPGSQRIRKSQSEESVTNADPYDLVRRQRLHAAEQDHQQLMLHHHHHHHVHAPNHHAHPPHLMHHHIHPSSPPIQMELNSNPAMQWFEEQLDQPPLNDEDEETNNETVETDENDHALEYAEADYIYNAVSRRLPIPPAIPQSVLQMRHQKRMEIEAFIKKQHRSKSQSKNETFHPLVRSSSSVVRSASANKVFSTTFNSLKRKVKDDQKVKNRQRPPSNSQDPSPPNLPLPPPPIQPSVANRPAFKSQNNMPKGAPLSSVSAVTSAITKTQKLSRMNTTKSSAKAIENLTSSSSPLSSVPSESSGSTNEIVTVNGGHGTKNSSIIYLSPERSTPPRNLTTVTNDSVKKVSEPITETLIRIKRNGRGSQMKNLNSKSASHVTTMVTVNDSKTDTTILPVTQDNNIKVSQKLTKRKSDYREESETDIDERGDSNTERGDSQGDNDTVDTSDKETSADEVSDDSVLQSVKSHQEKVSKLAKQNEERRKQIFDKSVVKGNKNSTTGSKNHFDKKGLLIDLENSGEDSEYDADLSCTLESPKKIKVVNEKILVNVDKSHLVNKEDPSHRQKIIVKGPKHQSHHHLSHESILEEDGDLKNTNNSALKYSKSRPHNLSQKSIDASQRVIKRVDGTTTSSDSESIHSGTGGGLNSRRSSLSGDELAPGVIKSSRACTSKLVQLYQRRKQMQKLSAVVSNENGYEEDSNINLNEVSISDARKSTFSQDVFKELGVTQTSLPPHIESSNQLNNETNPFAKFHSFQQVASKESLYHSQDGKYAEPNDGDDNFRHYLFNDTTRLRMISSRPNLKEAFQRTPNTASLNKNMSASKLGRRGISQSFKDKLISPTRPKDPPPPPPNQISKSQSVNLIKTPQQQNLETAAANQQQSRKFIQFSAPEMKRLNRMIMRRSSSSPATTNNLQSGTKGIYDIAENEDEDISFTQNSLVSHPVKNKHSSTVSNRLQERVISYSTSSLQRNPYKPPRISKNDRSHSFSSKQNQIKPKSNIFNRSISHIARSISNSSLEEGNTQKNVPLRHPDPYAQTIHGGNNIKGFSSTDLVTLLPHEDIEERMGFKDIRKILSSPSISSVSSTNSTGHYPQRIVTNGRQRKSSEAEISDDNNRSSEHIYEVIPENETNMKNNTSAVRPLPPLPIHPTSQQQEVSLKEKKLSSSSTTTIKTVTSEINSDAQVKSIFEGATKYDILHYLEDAKERGLTDVELDTPDDAEEVGIEDNEEDTRQQLVRRNHANRVSNISNSSSGSSSASSGSAVLMANKDRWSTVDIERNDSGLGSETGKPGKRPGIRVRDKQPNIESIFVDHHEHICEDCDQPIEDVSHIECDEMFDPSGPVCVQCAKRRCERKEIITEIIDTEIKYGRDLRIIQEEFYRPMQVAGLLTSETLSGIFLNVEELSEVNKRFTESLKDAIEIALDEGDEDLCTVNIGKLFLEAEPMLGAFKSYCTRQGSASAQLAGMEKEKELLRIFLKVSQMENTILRRMNLSSFLMVPVQRVTKYPLLLSRLLKVTPSHHEDRTALQESRENIEHHLEHMNQETRDSSSTRLWRRISMINVSSYRKMDNQLDVLGNTTWGIRKMALDVLQWTKETRDDVNFVLEGKLLFTPSTEANWKRVWTVKMTPVSALLVTLGHNSLDPPSSLRDDGLTFPIDTGVREAALLLIREKNNRYSMIREPIFLDKCVICWEQDWDDYFEIQEVVAKEAFIFKAEDIPKTRQWFKALQFYGLSLGNWRRRRNALANIMINGMARDHRQSTYEAEKKYAQLPLFNENSLVPANNDNNGSLYSNSGTNRNNTENLL